VNPARVSFDHSDDRDDMDYFLGLARRGYFLSSDTELGGALLPEGTRRGASSAGARPPEHTYEAAPGLETGLCSRGRVELTG
jgi:hypothetical protein